MKKNNLSLLSELCDFGQNLKREVLYKSNIFTPSLELLTLSGIWIALILIANPGGNFPLNDDWSYALAVNSLLSTGHLQIIDWIATTSVAQVAWGALFALPFGFSFTALRVSTLVLGLVGILATYQLLKEITPQKEIAFWGALVIATNPLYFALSNTFMTDVPFYTVAVLTFLFLVRSLHQDNKSMLVIGSVFACLAVLIRQIGILIPLAFAFTYIIKRRSRKEILLVALFPTVLCVLTLLIYSMTLGLPTNYGHFNLQNALTKQPGVLLISIFQNGFVAFAYLGLFLFPFLLIFVPHFWRLLSSRERIWASFTLPAFWIGVMGLLAITDRSMPLLKEAGNILIDTGLGPLTLRDVLILKLPHLPKLSKAFWLITTALSGLGAILLFHILFFAAKRFINMIGITNQQFQSSFSSIESMTRSFALFTCVLYLMLIFITGFFDRYLLFLLPFILLISLEAQTLLHFRFGWWQRLCVFLLIGMYTSFSVGATHDYLSWNRARWMALQHLIEQLHVSPSNIDGGYEFNGWYEYDPGYQPRPEMSWWWVVNDEYVIAFGPITNYQILQRFSYERWIPYQQSSIYLLYR